MTILDLLNQAGANVAVLVAFINGAKEKYPDMAPQADEIVNGLNQAITADNLAALAGAIPGELLEIVRGQLSPKDPPSGAI